MNQKLDRILIVDDELPIRKFLRVSLESNGYEVIETDPTRERVMLQNERALHGEHVISPKTVTWMEAAARISGDYRARIEGMGKSGEEADELRRAEAVERELRLAGLRAERETYYRLGRERKLSDDIVRRLVAEVDHAETRLG